MQGGWKGGKGNMGAGGVVGNMEQDVGGCKSTGVRLGGEYQGILWGYKGRSAERFCGAWRGGRGCWNLHPSCADKRHHPAPYQGAEPRLGWARPSWIWGENINIYLGLFLTILVQKEPKAEVEMTS